MRTIPSNTLVKLSEQYGTEPVTIVVVSWDRSSQYWYADRELAGIHGKILTVSDMDTVVNVSGSSDSEEVSIILDDTNGEIKTLMDNNDAHKTEAWVYQYFYGMDLDDKFLLFKGQVNSPIIWSEGDRTISFNIVSQLEDDEVGFSPEEGQFENIADELIGKPWPMIFGSVTGARALRITRVGAAITGQGISLPDFTLLGSIAIFNFNIRRQEEQVDVANGLFNRFLNAEAFALLYGNSPAADYWQDKKAKAIENRENAKTNLLGLENRRQEIQDNYDEQVSSGSSSSVKIIDSSSPIPTGDITVKIGGARFIGFNTGSEIIFTSHSIGWSTAPGEGWIRVNTFGYVPRELTDEPLNLPTATGINVEGSSKTWAAGTSTVTLNTFPHFRPNGSINGNSLGYFHANAGATIEVITLEPQKYIVSLTPGTVTRISAYRTVDGLRVLMDIPGEYWGVNTESYGSVTAVVITTTDALSKLGNWEDEIFIDFVSDIGPNTVNIMEYLIDTYSSLTYDTTTFDSVKTALANYPSNFVLYDRRNLLDLLKDIAWQCRCSIKLVNDIFYLTYLSTTPSVVDTIEQNDILVDSLELGYTQTEDLVTKMVCTWETSGFQKEKHRTILKNNVAKYGIQEQDYDFYIYNYIDAVIKSATFWLIRYSNTWRKATFITPITKLNIETLDAITLDISFISNDSITSIVESAVYDSANNGISFECWLPILAGTTVEYVFAFPASADSTETFQADLDTVQSYRVGEDLRQYGRTTNNPYKLKSGSVDRRFKTLGSRIPSDSVDTRPNLTSRGTIPSFSVLPAQGPETQFYSQIELLNTDFEPTTSISEIDIHNTTIRDSTTGKSCALDTFFDRIDEVDGSDVLIVSATHSVVGEDDDTNEQIAQFHYRWYDTESIWGAGTAFLQT